MTQKIIRLLNENARLTNSQLAVMLNTTEDDIKREIAVLEESGVIRGYKPLINWDKVAGERTTALIELKVAPKKETGFDTIAHTIMEFTEVESVYLMSGGFDLAVLVHGKTMQDIAMFVARRLSTLDGVLSTATHFILTKYKEADVILTDDDRDRREYTL
jgi:DNA-binding Lrp family transcriptional regulator